MKIGFIGAGNMGGAILKGYLPYGKAEGNEILVNGANHDKLRRLQQECGITPCFTAEELVAKSDIVILGVKPNKCIEILTEVKDSWTEDKMLVSMAAGITIAAMEGVLGAGAKVMRIMPNTPAQVGEAMISLSGNSNVTAEELKMAENIFRCIGQVRVVDEDLIHCVIGVSGSSPAYTYMYIDALAKAAEQNGMKREDALVFAAQSVLGAARMVLETGEAPDVLVDKVCSPGGTTIEAVNKFKELNFEGVVKAGFQAATDKSIDMSK